VAGAAARTGQPVRTRRGHAAAHDPIAYSCFVRKASGRRGILERFLFSFMGPPQLGDVNAPPADLPVVPSARCPKCRLPYDEHEVVRDPGLTYTRCPAAEPR
jgi:hypothetical protein